MAKADKFTGVSLKLTMEQAFYLRMLLLNVGGSPRGPRGEMDEIYTELSKFSNDLEALDLPELEIRGSVIMNNVE